MTIKSLFSLLEKKFISNNKNYVYGLSSEYDTIEAAAKEFKKTVADHKKELEKFKKTPEFLAATKPGEKEKLIKEFNVGINNVKKALKQHQKDLISNKLKQIYDNDDLDSAVETKFVIPNISMLIETVPALTPIDKSNEDSTIFDLMANEQGAKHITRVHIYDERAAANSDAKFYQQLIENLAIKTSGGNITADSQKISKSGIGSVDIFTKKELKDLSANLGMSLKEISQLSSQPKTAVVLNSENITTEDLKDKIKDYFPNITFGANNSTVKSLSFQSSTSGDVNNVLLLNSLNNKKTGTPNRSDLVDQEDVRVIPSTVTLNCMGLPIIQRGNQVYIDTGTGTTLDNIYTVTNVTHTIGPGDFTTNLTLTCTNQGDTDSLRDKIDIAQGLS
jgi:hypothetical protein